MYTDSDVEIIILRPNIEAFCIAENVRRVRDVYLGIYM